MKKLLFITLLLPLGLMAQKDSGKINFHLSATLPDTVALKYFTYNPGDYIGTPELNITPQNIPPTLKVFDNHGAWNSNYKLLMETDTAGNIHVYGDTLSVLKAIIKSYHVKLKE